MRDGPWRVASGWFPEAQRRNTVRPPIYYGYQYVASRAVTVWWGSSRFSRSNQGLTRLSRSLKTVCGWNVDTGQLWRAFEHILPLNHCKTRFVRLILHLRGQGICWNYFQLLNYNIFCETFKKMTWITYFNSMYFWSYDLWFKYPHDFHWVISYCSGTYHESESGC